MKMFWMTKRGRIAIVFIILGVLDICAAISMPIYRKNLLLFIMLIVIGLALLLPEFSYLFLPPEAIWAKWVGLDESKHQQRRMLRAMIQELTPQKLNRRFRCATFIGNEGGKYTTNLNGCTCMDFRKRRVPCKHMYYLAMQLGLVDIPKNVIYSADRIEDSDKLPDHYQEIDE